MSDPVLAGPPVQHAPVRRPWPMWKKILLRVGIAAAIGVGFGVYHEIQNRGKVNDQSAAVRAAANADSCSYSGYEIRQTAGGHFEPVYNCSIHGQQTCVLYVNGLASDVTSDVSDDFSDTLGNDKPACIKDS